MTNPTSPTKLLQVDVWQGQADGAFVRYSVPRQESQTVLDVVTQIQRQQKPDLSYRFACRVGMCGSCAMTVNGRACWTCRTHVASVVKGDHLQIAPLANLPVVKDLVTDMAGFFDKWQQAQGYFEGAQTRADDFARVQPQSPERQAVDAGIECIGCGVCYASCDVVSWRPSYLGPAALNRAWTLMNDVRDTQGPERLRAVSGDAGCQSCHSQGSCTERCPKQLAPTAGIAGLKRLGLQALREGKL